MKKTTPKLIIKCNLDNIANERGLTAYQVADLAGLSRPTIYGLISNRISPSMQTLSKLANGLGVTHEQLFRTETL